MTPETETIVRLHGQRVGTVRPRGVGFEGLTARGNTLGIYNTQWAAARAVIVVEAHRREMRGECG